MSAEPEPRDLIVLAADRDTEAALRSLLSRRSTLGIRELDADFRTHPRHDSGCYNESHEFLRPFVRLYRFALVVFDREGSGCEMMNRVEIERAVENQLSLSGWDERSATIVLDPELEIWVWSDSPHVSTLLGWQGRVPDLRSWLATQGFLFGDGAKPARPKEAMLEALRAAGKRPSPAVYKQLAERVSLSRCSDPAFGKLKTTLRNWFRD